MDISRIRALRGPNLWSRHTAIEAVVRLAEDDWLLRRPGLDAALRERFPQIGPWPLPSDQMSLAHVLAQAAEIREIVRKAKGRTATPSSAP